MARAGDRRRGGRSWASQGSERSLRRRGWGRRLLDHTGGVVEHSTLLRLKPAVTRETMSWRNATLLFELAESEATNTTSVYDVVLVGLEDQFSVKRQGIQPELFVLSGLLGL